MTLDDRIKHVAQNFSRIYLGGIPSLLNDDGAFLSFICGLTAIEALAGLLNSDLGNGERFRMFIQCYFPEPYPAQAENLWKLRNAIVHAFSTGPYGLSHHQSEIHLKHLPDGRAILNAEDFYAALVTASKKYFDDFVSRLCFAIAIPTQDRRLKNGYFDGCPVHRHSIERRAVRFILRVASTECAGQVAVTLKQSALPVNSV